MLTRDTLSNVEEAVDAFEALRDRLDNLLQKERSAVSTISSKDRCRKLRVIDDKVARLKGEVEALYA